MSGYGARAYQQVNLDSGVNSADPHRLVLMLFDGALEAIRLAAAHIAAGNVAEKGRALGKAVRIVEEGLKASLDKDAGGPLAKHLAALYDYATLRLLHANLKNDRAALDEAGRLLADLREAWARIGERMPAAAAVTAVPSSDDSNANAARRVALTA